MKAVCSLVLLVALAAPLAAQERGPAIERIASASEMQLDSMYAPLTYLMRPEERGIYSGLTVTGKREFLRRFWAERNPNPGARRNEAAEVFNQRLGIVNRKFSVTGAVEIPGWRTDRGRIYLQYGQPDLVLARHGPGAGMPYEVWKYMRPKPRKYCFVDVTRFGLYSLVYSTDPREPTRPNWDRLIGEEAYEDALRF